MKNIVTELSCINEATLTAALNLERTDKLIIITDENGSLPVSLFELLSSLKVKPKFIPLADSQARFMFTIGQLSNECKDIMYLLFPDREYVNELDRESFKSLSGDTITLRACNSFAEILKDKSNEKKTRTSRKKVEEQETPKKTKSIVIHDEPLKEVPQEQEDTSTHEDPVTLEFEEEEDQEYPLDSNTLPVEDSLGEPFFEEENIPEPERDIEEEMTIEPAPKTFIVKLKNIITASNKLDMLNTIMEHVDKIAHCFRESTDLETGLAFLFNLYLSELFDTDDLYDVLYEYYDELKSLASIAA